MGLRSTKIGQSVTVKCRAKCCDRVCEEYKRTDKKIYWHKYCPVHKCPDTRCTHFHDYSNCYYLNGQFISCARNDHMTADREEDDAHTNPEKY